jgi:hypothetical protein
MALPNVAEVFVLPANPPVVAFRQHTHSFDGVVHMLRKLRGRASGRKLIGVQPFPYSTTRAWPVAVVPHIGPAESRPRDASNYKGPIGGS